MQVNPSLLFFGAGRFSRKVAVVVPPGKTELASVADDLKIEVLTAPPKTLKGWLPDRGPWDFGAVASFSYFLPAPLIDSFQCGVVNAHPSLLPRYRGAAPIQRSMIDEFAKGISIIGLDKKEYDAGKIYLSEITEFNGEQQEDMDYYKLEERLAHHCGSALARVLNNWDRYSKKAVEQSGQVTYAPKITKGDAHIAFKDQTSRYIYGRYLAIGHQENLRAALVPSGKVIHLLDIVRPPSHSTLGFTGKTGHVQFLDSILWIQCADGRWIGVDKFRVEGKSNTFSAKEFYKNFIMRHPIQYFE